MRAMAAFTEIPEGWGLWFHGTPEVFDSFDDAKLAEGHDCNSGLGHFLAAGFECAMGYAQSFYEAGQPAYVLVVVACEQHSYEASTDEFWCDDESEDDALANEAARRAGPRGASMRARLMREGFRSLVIDEVEGEGAVMAAFEASSMQVLRRLTLEQAEALSERLQDYPLPLEPRERFSAILAFLDAEDVRTLR